MKTTPDISLERLRMWLLGDAKVTEQIARDTFEVLDNWLTGGGPLPEDWRRIREMMKP